MAAGDTAAGGRERKGRALAGPGPAVRPRGARAQPRGERMAPVVTGPFPGGPGAAVGALTVPCPSPPPQALPARAGGGQEMAPLPAGARAPRCPLHKMAAAPRPAQPRRHEAAGRGRGRAANGHQRAARRRPMAGGGGGGARGAANGSGGARAAGPRPRGAGRCRAGGRRRAAVSCPGAWWSDGGIVGKFLGEVRI